MSQVFDMTMLGGGVHLWRLVRVLRVLKRFDAWFAVRRLGPHPWFIRLGLWVATFGVVRKRRLPDRQGERLAAALAHLGPAFVKLGQMLATRADLVGPDLAADLRRLQDRMDPFSADQARAAVEETLGRPIAQMFTRFDDRPIAAASIAQVHKAITVDGQTVACKVLRPDVEQRFYRDLRAFAWVARLAELVATEARRLRAQAVVRTLAQSVARELDLRLEAAAASELADNMAGEPGYRLPQVLWTLTGRRVLTMEWIDGVPLADTESVKAAGHDLRHLAERVVQTFLKRPCATASSMPTCTRGIFSLKPMVPWWPWTSASWDALTAPRRSIWQKSYGRSSSGIIAGRPARIFVLAMCRRTSQRRSSPRPCAPSLSRCTTDRSLKSPPETFWVNCSRPRLLLTCIPGPN